MEDENVTLVKTDGWVRMRYHSNFRVPPQYLIMGRAARGGAPGGAGGCGLEEAAACGEPPQEQARAGLEQALLSLFCP